MLASWYADYLHAPILHQTIWCVPGFCRNIVIITQCADKLRLINLAGSFPPAAATSAANWAAMPAVFGILAFVYSGHGVFPSVRASMKEPKEYPKARPDSSTAFWSAYARCA